MGMIIRLEDATVLICCVMSYFVPQHSSVNISGLNYVFFMFFTDHYRFVANNYDYFYNRRHEAQFTVLLKHFDIQPEHKIVDIGSGTSDLAERLSEKFQLKYNVWCVEPSAEMQEVAKKKKGVFPIQKTADEFLSDLRIDQHFDRAVCVGVAHHFADPVKIYRSVEAFLSPYGVFWVVQVGEYLYPWFTKIGNGIGAFLGERKEETASWLQLAKFDVEVSEEKVDYSVKKSQWYDMLRGRFHSTLEELSDEEIEEGIDELEKGKLKDLKLHDDIHISCKLLVFTARKRN